MKNAYFYNTILGKITIADNGESVTNLEFGQVQLGDAKYIETPLIKEAYTQLNEYLTGERKDFDLPLEDEGTEFQKKVWKALRDIPYGKTWTYKQVAEKVGNVKACRAVGGANNKNPISIFTPCHRVIGSNGKLVGYGGGLDIKEKLLELESNYCK